MSRPIKYKFFYKPEQRFISLWAAGWRFEPENGQIYSGDMNITERFEIVQYTGLKDRNGKEIYEGDIVEELDYSDGAYFPKERQPKKRTVVEYDIGFVYARAAYNLRGRMENDLYNGEVIGNIYETPLEDTP